MPLVTYLDTRPWAKAIRDAVITRKMPPWFADPHYGKFCNDRTLAQADIDTLAAWANSGAKSGRPAEGPVARVRAGAWNIGTPDAVLGMPKPFRVPAEGDLPYQYFIVPTSFAEDRWVQAVELRPGDRAVVHHAVVYVHEPGTPVGTPTKSDILFTYTPGNSYDAWPDGMAKLIPAGSELMFEMHYTPAKRAVLDQSRIGIVFAQGRPKERILTLQLNQDRFMIPPGHPDYRVTVSGTLPNQARLLSLYPHMHLRGKAFEYAIYGVSGRETLLKVDNYDFYWQLNYKLAEPLVLAAGTKIECVATFDNSRNNPRNPDPDAMVRYGQQSTSEMMVGFFDIAVDAGIDKSRFFERTR